ncbi:MAG: bifunctional metallophosphatase/5'-nucleotidase [Clostridiales bacterium]|nr:bifunctional metallophosphatase/5'-nucleotidase [Clostridiales bacterium]
MKLRKLISLLLAAVMLLGAVAFAEPAKIVATDYTGKTIILHTNDVHGAIDGYAYIPTLRNYFISFGADDVIVVDAGDFSQGTIYVSTNKGAVAVDMMNAAGYDIVTLGNHEFDFGYAQVQENLSKAEFTAICANVIKDEDGEAILPAYTLWTGSKGEEPLKIGFVGIETPETATKVNPGLIKEIHFATFEDHFAYAQAAVDMAKAEGADMIIALAHLGVDNESAANGYRSVDLLEKVEGIDFTIDGHSHTVMSAGNEGQAIQSTGTKFAYIGVVVIDNASKTVEDNFLVSTSGLAKDPMVAAKAEGIISAIDAMYNSVFASTEVELNGAKAPGNRTEETNLGDLITDAMVWSVVKEGGIEQVEPNNVVGITNGGGIRATIAAGDITMKDINTVLPFGNTVAVIYATGAELLEALEASTFCTPDAVGGFPQTSGIKWTLDTTKPFDQGSVYTLDGKEGSYYAPASIQRVTIEEINGEPFDVNAVYAVVTNNFCAAGGDTYNVFYRAYSEGAGFDTGIPMDEALMEYIEQVLEGKITAETYGEPRGTATQILAEAEADAAA